MILITTIILNIKLVTEIKNQFNLKYKSLKLTSFSSNAKLKNHSDDRLKTYKIIFSKSRSIEIHTTLLIFWITLLFIIDQFVQAISGTFYIFIKKDSLSFTFILAFIFLIIFSTQLTYFFIYYKFNRAFSRRFWQLFS